MTTRHRVYAWLFHRDWPWRKPLGEWYLRDVVWLIGAVYFAVLLLAALTSI